MRRTTLSVLCILALTLGATAAWGQAPPVTTPPGDTLKIEYFANANTGSAPDATVRLTNPGTAPGNICANIFVFDSFQELSECCSCFLSPDGLRTLSVNTDLTSNPLTGVILNTGAIKVVSTTLTAGTCPLPTRINAIPAVRAWATHIQNSNFAVTESAAQDATFSAGELVRLQAQCTSIALDGSGHGVCTCGSGD